MNKEKVKEYLSKYFELCREYNMVIDHEHAYGDYYWKVTDATGWEDDGSFKEIFDEVMEEFREPDGAPPDFYDFGIPVVFNGENKVVKL